MISVPVVIPLSSVTGDIMGGAIARMTMEKRSAELRRTPATDVWREKGTSPPHSPSPETEDDGITVV